MTPLLVLALAALPPASRLVIPDPSILPKLRETLAWVSLLDRRFDPKELERGLASAGLRMFDSGSWSSIGMSGRLDVYVGAALVVEARLEQPDAFEALRKKPLMEVALWRKDRVARAAVGRSPHDAAELAKDLDRAKPKVPRCAAKRSAPALLGDVPLPEVDRGVGAWFSGLAFAAWLTQEGLEVCADLVPRPAVELALGTMSARSRGLRMIELESTARGTAHLGAENLRRLAGWLGATSKDASVLSGDLEVALTERGILAIATLVAPPAKEKLRAARSEAIERLSTLLSARFPGTRVTVIDDHLVASTGALTEEELRSGTKKGVPAKAPMELEVLPPKAFGALEARALRGEPGPPPMAYSMLKLGFGAFLVATPKAACTAFPRAGRLEVSCAVQRARDL
ncbi:MAG: hypothetical protein HYV07_07490 [Deltaproteobacteria bacterium]|nr:hypothetical protein [Deltaproteobacteria bacterium]